MKRPTTVYLTEKTRQAYLRRAHDFDALDFQGLFDLPASQQVPRTFDVTMPQTIGCLVCGRRVMEYGNYSYLFDIVRDRWKITCPSCGTVFPTNDFGAYYRGGLDEYGFFRPDRARAHDRALIAAGGRGNLVNVLYPERGEKWGVDDGFGCTDPDTGVRYNFVGYINHSAWDGLRKTGIRDILTAFRNAYTASGDPVWAARGIVLLDRVADVYPELSLALYPWAQGYLNSHGGGIDKGKAVGSIWECALVSALMEAFRVFAEPLLAGKLPDAVDFIARQPHRITFGPETARTVHDRIMHGIVAQVFPAVMTTDIHGNYGMHQAALALAAVIWDRNPDTRDWLDFDFRTSPDYRQRLYGGSISAVMTDSIDRDGYGEEASPGYNSLWLDRTMQIARILDGYELGGQRWDLFDHPKLRRMLRTFYPLALSDRYYFHIGDSASCGNPGLIGDTAILLEGFLRFGDPELAQAAHMLAGFDSDRLNCAGFDRPPEEVRARVQAVLDEYGPLSLGGTNLTGYGFTALRDGVRGAGDADTQRALAVYYGRNTRHGHLDTLNIALIAHGLDLMPDMGYPRYADMLDMHRASVVHNTLSHNTVVVNDAPQTLQYSGTPLHYDWSGPVKLFDIDAPCAYRDTVRTYRRSAALIRIDERDSYAADFFRVSGGSSHCYSFHGAEAAAVVCEGLTLVPQTDAQGRFTGTAAGPDTAYPDNADVRDLTGARYLTRVERARNVTGGFTADYSVLDTWNVFGHGASAPTDVHVKLHLRGDFDQVTLADLRPPETKVGNPKRLRYVLARRAGEDLESCFAAVIEPYRGSPRIAAVEDLPVTRDGAPVSGMEARALKVTLKTGRTDRIVCAADPGILYTVLDGAERFDFRGFFGLWTRDAGQDRFYLNDASRLGPMTCAEPAVTGTVADFTRSHERSNFLTMVPDAPPADPAALTGRYVYVDTDPDRCAVYEIHAITPLPDGSLRFDLGDVTLIRGWADPTDFSRGYVYDVAPGRRARVPMGAAGESEE